MELSIHRDDKAYEVIQKYSKLKKISDLELGEYYEIDREKTDNADVLNLFGFFKYPLLEVTKLDMKKEAEHRGFMDVMVQTVFCHHPINNKPCGYCNPCIYTIEEVLRWRFDKLALLRYFMLSGLKKLLKKR